MDKVFILQHVRPAYAGCECEDTKFIGAYGSREAAMQAVERLRMKSGFREYPRLYDPDADDVLAGFCIDAYALDQDHWTEGFVGHQGEADADDSHVAQRSP
jgi:hypothetical protein